MFLLYVLGVFAISLFGSQCQPQTRETMFQCKSWGDPHIQTWHPKNGDKIQQRDCYVNGKHVLINNTIISLIVTVHNKWVTHIDLKIHNENGHLLLHYKSDNPNKVTADEDLRQAGITVNSITSGLTITTTITYPRENTSVVMQGQNAKIDTIQLSVPHAMAAQSEGLCSPKDAACTLRGLPTDELEWQPVRSGSAKQIFTNQQAEMICNEHIETFFTKIHRAPNQRDAHVNSMVASVLSGCIDDVVLTGEIEAAQAGIALLMIDELTKDATTVKDIEAAVQGGIEQASLLLDDAVKTANARVRRFI